ncbi:MAG: SDR family NAD(P)-dependent oxidoreductase [Clostridia bacterium]|nr:SDR family NAD(P)-dependent oxidoreductase [Clostridia bacterium]
MPYAVVTGADHGLGLALAEALARRGFAVIAGYLNPAETQLSALSDAGLPVHPLPLDIASDASIAAFAEAARRLTPAIELMINNAGVLGDMQKTIADPLVREDIRRVIEVNAIGTLMLTNALFPLLTAGERRLIVNISSEAGSIGDCWREGWFGYCMSKAANNMQGALVHNLLRPLGGQVIQMHPGHVISWMRGHLDTTGKLFPAESAEGILRVVLDEPRPVRDRPWFLDNTGAELPF